MKRVIAAMMILVMALSMSGCKISYWDGLSKSEAKELVLNMLEEKYGEEFVVKNMYTPGGTGYNTPSDLRADCSPKYDENILFSAQIFPAGKKYTMDDTYIQSIVRQEIREIVEPVLEKHYNKFAFEIKVDGLNNQYDSGIRVAKEATIKNYSEAIPETNQTHIWIALNNNEIKFQDELYKMVEELTTDFCLINAIIDIYYANDDVINECVNKINSSADRLKVYGILSGKFPCDTFIFVGNKKENKLNQVEFANK